MSKITSWIGFVYDNLPIFILGWLLTDLRVLYQIYFGKDVLNTILSVLLVVVTLFIIKKRTIRISYSLHVFLILVIITPHILQYLHNFPNYVTGCYYFIIVILAFLGSNQASESKSPVWISILVFLVGTGGHELLNSTILIECFIIASVITSVYIAFKNTQESNKKLTLISLALIPLLAFGVPQIEVHSSQKKFYDPVVLSETTPFQQIDVTGWKGNLWYYMNGVNLFSSVDYWLYYEPMIHPAMGISVKRDNILIIGGENGLAVKEVLKYNDVNQIDIIPLDTALTSLASTNPLFTKFNGGSLKSDKVEIKSADVFHQLDNLNQKYDVIIADLPDPMDIITNQYYTREFYKHCMSVLTPDGVLVTQSGSPYFATQAFQCINNTLQSTGFHTTQIHNQILTTGEWGWTIATINKQPLDSLLSNHTFDLIETQWINPEAMQMMLSYGKDAAMIQNTDVNTISTPLLYKYYNEGNWKHK